MSQAGASPSTGITRLRQYCGPLRLPVRPPPGETYGSLSRRTGSPLSPVKPSPTCCCHYPGGPDGCICRSFPIRWSLPRVRGGSASTTSFSRPARHLHVTACQIARPPSAVFVTRHRPGSCPPTVARQLPSPIDFGSRGLFLHWLYDRFRTHPSLRTLALTPTALARRDFLALPARLGKADGDRLLAAGDGLSAPSASECSA